MMSPPNRTSDEAAGTVPYQAPTNGRGDNESAGIRRPPSSSRSWGAAGITPRLLNLNQAAEYLGISYWSVRDLVQSGMLASVKLPAPRARDGRSIRRTLIDRQDLDELIESWKEQNAA